VDHLHTLVYSEPEGDGYLRRQYLVLYDTVPGGTGYLKDFTREPTDAETMHPLLEILQRALDRMTSCACFHEPDKDGCYRCLFAYRNSREMSETSSALAIDLYTRILSHADQLQRIDALSDVSVSGLMDSVLEARFVEALRRLGTDERPVRVEKAIVRNKPGYRATVGGQVWNIEQQLTLGASEGIVPTVSIDFVFHPASASEGRQPIAVFLDGFQFHRDRVGFDLLQRMTLLTSGSYDVWSFSWYDIDEAFHTDVTPAPFLVHPKLPTLKTWLTKLGMAPAAGLFEERIIDVFVDSLAGDGTAWDELAAATLIAQMKRPDEVDPAVWMAEVDEKAPPAARPWFQEVDSTWLRVHRPPTAELPFGVWAAAPPSALGRPLDPSAFRLLVWLDDREERRDTAEFRGHWRGFLHTFQYLRGLPHGWFVTEESLDYSPLSLSRMTPEEARTSSEAWAELDVDPAFLPIVEALLEQGLPRPEVGLDLLDARGHTCGLEGELVWETEKVAVVESLDPAERPVAPDWRVFELADLLADIGPLIAALRTAGDR
jgi:DEAD/DEAH box helicase domain-containing protein